MCANDSGYHDSITSIMATNNPPSPNSNKRKRGESEQDGRNMKSPATNGDSAVTDAMYASLLQGITDSVPPQDETSRTAQAALQQQQQSAYPEPNAFDHAAMQGGFEDPTAHMQQHAPQHQMSPGGIGILDARQNQQGKPQVGSPAWHQQRKDNHKEGKADCSAPIRSTSLTYITVERRRREVINEGIENLSKMIPTNSDKNKGAILTGAIKYIQDLQARIQGFDNERSVFEITQQELTRRNESLRDSAQRAWGETAKWMGRCKEAGLQFDDYDTSVDVHELEDPTNTHMGGVPVNDNTGFNAGNEDKVESAMA